MTKPPISARSVTWTEWPDAGPGVAAARAPVTLAAAGLPAALILGLACHALFSSLGLNPTDNGFILAGARRILEGQVPHRDFISVRPAGSLFLHAPLVWLGGSHVLWLSRGVAWLELAVVAWVWTRLCLDATTRTGVPPGIRLAVMAIALFLSAHSFPIMAWHTTDALFLTSVGIWLLRDHQTTATKRWLACALLGIAPLCRQSFAIVPIFAILLLGHGRRPGSWIFLTLPGALYVGALAASGGLDDALLQLRTYGAARSWDAGVTRFVTHPGVHGGISVGLAGVVLACGLRSSKRFVSLLRPLGSFCLYGLVAFAVFYLPPGNAAFPWSAAFVLFGGAFGASLGLLLVTGEIGPLFRAGALGCVLAWSVAVSIGYNSPALGASPLAALLLALFVHGTTPDPLRPPMLARVFLIALLLAASVSFALARVSDIYRDAPANELVAGLGDVLPGAQLIRTNPRTRLFFTDLGEVERHARARGKRLAVLPDGAAWWVANPEPNPLPVDWALDVELGRPELVRRTIETIEGQRGEILVAVQKFETNRLAVGFRPLSETRYEVANAVRRDLEKTGETFFFELYE